ncbi:hypothetical protein M0657_011945 [Pyricularia oryzae]|uniref:Uncharacterized protein n=1 Tax=Pyricularia oryzae TaxID=318829 RepID=A0A4P7NW46_PYROR|nr:hypothetical protein M0657_011945 [Pyricularia oryzae]KAI7909490.1 hypothetical protein M9X92_011609 [Pyricularia oryzae]QBZ66750.1 hypothetical protein PoMZ_13737 [Pyricularia oryzae]
MAFPQLQWQPCYNGPEGCSSSKLNHTERSPCAGSESLGQNHLVSDFRFVLGSNEPEQDVHEGTISSESAESRRKLVSEPSIQTLECHTDTAGQSWGQSDPFGTAFYGIPPVPRDPPTGSSHFNQLENSTLIPASCHCSPPAFLHYEQVSDFRQLVPKYRENWVLIIGGMAEAREQAKRLGFNKALISSDLAKESANVHPLRITASVHGAVAQPRLLAERSEPISAVLIFGQPQDWNLDLQILLALSISGNGTVGYGTRAGGSMQSLGYQQDCTLKIYGLECPMAQDDMCGFLCALQCKWKGWMTHGL